MDDFNIAFNRSILININGNKSQNSWEQITRTFSVQASCAEYISQLDAPRARFDIKGSLCNCTVSVAEGDNAAFRICPLPILLSFLECQKTAEAEIISEVQRAFLPHLLWNRRIILLDIPIVKFYPDYGAEIVIRTSALR